VWQIFGGLVWTLVASTKVLIANPQGWVMFVSVFCFIFTTLWFFIFISGANKSSIWPTLVSLRDIHTAIFDKSDLLKKDENGTDFLPILNV
jgi:hypothetical protein